MQSMPETSWLTQQLLIAMPGMRDPNFARSLVYLCQHDADGAMGLVINRAAPLRFTEILTQMHIPATDPRLDELPVLLGGPVQPERGFVLHTALRDKSAGEIAWDSSFQVSEELAVTTSRDVLEAIAASDKPIRALLALGYAGWAAGQLEQELHENAWLTVTLKNFSILFDIPLAQRWQAATALASVDLNRITHQVGHA